jgi:hypothetical protein
VTHLKTVMDSCAEVLPGAAALQALEYLERSCSVLPDLVLLDVMMPSMSGYEVAARLRQSYPSSLLPIIMVSAGCGCWLRCADDRFGLSDGVAPGALLHLHGAWHGAWRGSRCCYLLCVSIFRYLYPSVQMI